jgi:formylglycine-generating enzyme required for sulfatase activity
VGNQFTIDFVPISGSSNPAGGYGVVTNDYRMGTCEITNDQWNKFKANYGPVTGSPSMAYGKDPFFGVLDLPTNNVSWYEAAQFVNWLNTSTGHQAAYNFTGTKGTSDYTLVLWSTSEAANGTNLYRNKNAFYFLPTENEWVKAAYWNGTALQTYATKDDSIPAQGDGTNGTGWNYWTPQYAPASPWAANKGNQELNGTLNMMGNVCELLESPSNDPNYGTSSSRGVRGGSYYNPSELLSSARRTFNAPENESKSQGFRVASNVPEPGGLLMTTLFALGSLMYLRRRILSSWQN